MALSDLEAMNPVGGPVLLTDDQAQRWFTRMVPPGSSTDCYFLIFKKDNLPVGEISYHRLKLESMTAEFNIKIASTERGKGYAKEAVLLFLDYFFNHFGGHALVDNVALDNKTGQQVLLHFGFKHDPGIEDVFRVIMTKEQYKTLTINSS